MLIRIFRGTGPGAIFLIVFILGVLWTGALLDPHMHGAAVYETRPMLLYSFIKTIAGTGSAWGVLFTMVLLPLMLFLLVSFNTRVFFIAERTFFPAYIYLFLTSLFADNQLLNPVIPGALCLILAVNRIMDAYRKPGTANNFFDAGILISTGSLFYAGILWFGLLIFVGIALLRAVNIRELAISVLGLVTPYLIAFGIWYLLDRSIESLINDLGRNLFAGASYYSFSWHEIVVLIYIGILLLICIGFLMRQMNIKKIKSRKTYYLLLWMLFISLAAYIIIPSVSVEMLWIAAIPASYLLSHYFIFVKGKIIPDILFGVFMVLILTLKIFDLF